MKFRDPNTGKVFENIMDALDNFKPGYCYDDDCKSCPFYSKDGRKLCSYGWLDANTVEAARLMGYEVIEDETAIKTCQDCEKYLPATNGFRIHTDCWTCRKKSNFTPKKTDAETIEKNVDHPAHYNQGGVEDLDKAIWYIQRLKEEIGNG